jgi:hypothetical protein
MSLSVLPLLVVQRLQNGNASRQQGKRGKENTAKENTARKTATFGRRQILRERQRHFDEPIPLFDSGESTLLDIGVDALLKKINSQVSRAW